MFVYGTHACATISPIDIATPALPWPPTISTSLNYIMNYGISMVSVNLILIWNKIRQY